PIEIVALIAGMPLHRVSGVARVEMLDTNGDAPLDRMLDYRTQPAHAIVRAIGPADLAALGIVGIAPLVAGEGDDGRDIGLGTGVDGLAGAIDYCLVIARIVEATHEWSAGHAVGCDRAGEVVLAQHFPLIRRYDLDRLAAQIARHPASALQVPAIAHCVEAPEDHRLANSAVDNCFALGGRAGGHAWQRRDDAGDRHAGEESAPVQW